MSHGLQNSVAILRRFACHSDQPLPDDWNAFKAIHATEALSIERSDPELYQLLSGTASASLRADALEGNFSAKAPDPVIRVEEERQREVQDLFERRSQLTLTERLHLQRLDSKVYAEAMCQVGNGHQHEGESVEDRRRFEMERQRQRAEAIAASANHAQGQIRGGAGA